MDKTLALVWRQCFYQTTFYHKPREFQFTKLFACYKITIKKRKMRNILADKWARTYFLCHNSQRLNHCAADASIYIDLRQRFQHNNARKQDGHYRSWIEYLNDRY